MIKRWRFYLVALVGLVFLLTAKPSLNQSLKAAAFNFLEAPIAWSQQVGEWFSDLLYFRRNSEENRRLRNTIAQIAFKNLQQEELFYENKRLTSLLDLEQTIPFKLQRRVYARVVARSPSNWNRALWIDKGFADSLKPNRLILSELALIGKVVSVSPDASQVLLITDPNFKIGVLIQRTRQQGVLYATPSGECRVKYLSLDQELKPGDIAETAGYKGYFPKAIPIGVVDKVWREPGQMYQVASLRPIANLSRLEEVMYVE